MKVCPDGATLLTGSGTEARLWDVPPPAIDDRAHPDRLRLSAEVRTGKRHCEACPDAGLNLLEGGFFPVTAQDARFGSLFARRTVVLELFVTSSPDNREGEVAMRTVEVFDVQGVQVIKLPDQFRFRDPNVSIRKAGDAVILEPIPENAWPPGFSTKSGSTIRLSRDPIRDGCHQRDICLSLLP